MGLAGAGLGILLQIDGEKIEGEKGFGEKDLGEKGI